MFDLAIRGGTLVDGTGAPAVDGVDVLIEDGRIAEVGADLGGKARREIKADGLLVTPGFVDNHTHYDGQATWDDVLAPSVWHGVTTAIMGNCGVGFAPVRTEYHQALIELMEGVEDIPGSALSEGITWDWEDLPPVPGRARGNAENDGSGSSARARATTDLCDGTKRRQQREGQSRPTRRDVADRLRSSPGRRFRRLLLPDNAATARPTAARCLARSPEPTNSRRWSTASPTAGSASSRSPPTSGSTPASKTPSPATSTGWSTCPCKTGVTVTYSLLQNDRMPELWRDLLRRTQAARQQGGRVVALTAGRPTGILFGFGTSLHPFIAHRAFRPLKELPLPEKIAKLRTPEVREAILGDRSRFASEFAQDLATGFWKMYPIEDVPDYEPSRDDSVLERARRAGVDPAEYIYDFLLGDEGKALAFFPLGDFAHGNLDSTYERLQQPDTVLSLSDGGAHCRLISDASVLTYMLSYWARDRAKGPKLPVERAVELLTSESARLYGLADRGVLKPGYRADVNVINFEQLGFRRPEMVADLPAGGERFLQPATGYVATVCAGLVTVEHDEVTEARPGGLLRGPRQAPA